MGEHGGSQSPGEVGVGGTDAWFSSVWWFEVLRGFVWQNKKIERACSDHSSVVNKLDGDLRTR